MFAARQGFNYLQESGPSITFPANSIVPYYGTNLPSSNDWYLYGYATDFYIAGTTNPSLIQTTTGRRNASVNATTTSTTGAHTGSYPFISGSWKRGASNLNDISNFSAGAHAHTGGTMNFTVTPSQANVRLLISNKATPTIPAGTLGFRNPSTGTYGDRIYPNGSASYIVNGNSGGTMSNPSGNYNASRTTSSSSTHRHNSNNYLFLASGSLTNPTALNAGSHYHLLTASMSQTLMSNTMVLSAWTSAIARAPATDVIVMYNGLISNLTGTGWYLCDGTNGTLNINDYYVGVGSGWGDVYSSDAYMNSLTIDSGDYATHGHDTGSLGGSGVYAYHPTESWYHYHTLGYDTFLDFIGAKFYLHFIQYKG